MVTPRVKVLISMVLAAAASRLIPHAPNFTPIIALAIFGGAHFENKKIAFAIPLIAMVLSDIGLAILNSAEYFTFGQVVIYSCFALITAMGFFLRGKVKVPNVALASFAGSLVFFLVTNFAVWLGGTMYPMDLSGLIACYVAGIPFFNNTVLSSVLYSALLFGGFEAAKYKFPALAKITA